MTDSELRRLNILYDVRINQMSVTEIAKKYNVHRNTIRNVRMAYADIKDEDVIKYYENPSSSNNIFVKKRTPKVSKADLEIIEQVCKKYLNCYLTPEQICEKLCEKKEVEFDTVQNYDRRTYERLRFNVRRAKGRYISKIFSIRNKRHPSKNFQEVYEEYCAIIDSPVSRECFYLYARDFWIEADWENKTLGELIDTK